MPDTPQRVNLRQVLLAQLGNNIQDGGAALSCSGQAGSPSSSSSDSSSGGDDPTIAILPSNAGVVELGACLVLLLALVCIVSYALEYVPVVVPHTLKLNDMRGSENVLVNQLSGCSKLSVSTIDSIDCVGWQKVSKSVGESTWEIITSRNHSSRSSWRQSTNVELRGAVFNAPHAGEDNIGGFRPTAIHEDDAAHGLWRQGLPAIRFSDDSMDGHIGALRGAHREVGNRSALFGGVGSPQGDQRRNAPDQELKHSNGGENFSEVSDRFLRRDIPLLSLFVACSCIGIWLGGRDGDVNLWFGVALITAASVGIYAVMRSLL